jgi:hypothetical protein
MNDYDLDIVLVAHFAARVQGRNLPPLGQFAQQLFDKFDGLISARIPGLDAKQRSAIAVLAFIAPAQTTSQAADLAVAEFVAVNV